MENKITKEEYQKLLEANRMLAKLELASESCLKVVIPSMLDGDATEERAHSFDLLMDVMQEAVDKKLGEDMLTKEEKLSVKMDLLNHLCDLMHKCEEGDEDVNIEQN